MASILVDRKQNGDYVRLVESYRDVDGKSKIRTLARLGKLDAKKIASLKRIADKLYRLVGIDIDHLPHTGVKELGRYNFGFYQVVNQVFKVYGLDIFLNKLARKKKLSFNLYHCVLLMIIERLCDPSSKRGNYFNQHDYLGLNQAELHWLYRSLDYLADNKDTLQQIIYSKGRDLFNQRLDVVFYDVTTYYFDSDVEKEGELRQMGFGKDGKIGNTQILMGLMIDQYKQPIGYEIYQGAQFEGHTLKDSIEKLKRKYQIGKVIVVADRGMLNKDNIKTITEENRFDYIIGERLKTLPELIQQRLLDLKSYQKEWIMNDEKSLVVRYHTTVYNDRLIIGTWSSVRAEKDRKEREEKLAKIPAILKNAKSLQKKAAHYYLTTNDKVNYIVDQQKIDSHARYDGFLAIATNVKDIQIATALDHYKHLFQIEQAFRTFKSYLETRPMFHWTDKRIQGHMCLCYLAYTTLSYVLRKQPGWSENKLRKTLEKMQVSLVEQSGQQFYIRSAQTQDTESLIKTLEFKTLPEMIVKELINNYL